MILILKSGFGVTMITIYSMQIEIVCILILSWMLMDWH